MLLNHHHFLIGLFIKLSRQKSRVKANVLLEMAVNFNQYNFLLLQLYFPIILYKWPKCKLCKENVQGNSFIFKK